MTFSYYPNIPNGPNDPADDQPLMQTNAGSISSLISVDHIGFNTTNGGYHNVIHFIGQGVDPSNIDTIGQLYTKQVTFNSVTDTALFFESGLGTVTQLTTSSNSSASSNGYTFLPGGIILQWGRSSGGSLASTGTITFPIAFPNNLFIVNSTLIAHTGGTSSANTISYITGTGNTTSWQWSYTGTTSYIGFYWLAIGN